MLSGPISNVQRQSLLFSAFVNLIMNVRLDRPSCLLVIAKNLVHSRNDIEIQRLWTVCTHGITRFYSRNSEVTQHHSITVSRCLPLFPPETAHYRHANLSRPSSRSCISRSCSSSVTHVC